MPGGEATVKTFTVQGDSVVLVPANQRLESMEFPAAADVQVYGRVVTVLRRL
ncbi:MAG TPA: S24 family peptidase [Acidimicrobiales bacterium]|nr:S24 family peptidase [Acidimicrobiales bacterium]